LIITIYFKIRRIIFLIMQLSGSFLIIILSFAGLYAGCAPGNGDEIPMGPGIGTVPFFIGKRAVLHPLAIRTLPQHPFLAPQSRNGMHADSYCTDTYPWSGPLGVNPQVKSGSLAWWGGEVATVVFDRKGRLICVSGNMLHFRLLLLDPDTLSVLASLNLPQRASTWKFWTTFDMRVIMDDTSGGAYFHLDKDDRPLIATADRIITLFNLAGPEERPEWRIEDSYDLNPFLPDKTAVTDAMPDWQGRIWFVTRNGIVGYVEPDTRLVHTLHLQGEEIQNSLAVAEDGVYIVSDHALYRFEADTLNKKPRFTWREVYDRGSGVKPGGVNRGSGTTPTLFSDGLVAITDNADDRVNLLVYRRLPHVRGRRLVCKQPLFDKGRSVSENSIIAYGRSLIIENNYLYSSGLPTDPDPRSHPGVTRVDIDPDDSGCHVVWESREASQTTVPKLSLGNGLIYLYTRLEGTAKDVVAWYLTAIDYRTGKTVYKILTGTGLLWNNNYAPITIGPNGTAYVGCYNGIMAIRDGKPGEKARRIGNYR
jgi:outer membrane protein assembly factor BamB